MFKLAVLAFLVTVAAAAFYEDEMAPQWIEKINNDPSNTFTAGFNPYLRGKSLEDMKRLMGTKLDGKSKSNVRVKSYAPKAMPAQFTTGVDAWPNCHSTVSFIKDQADCGSCWAVAASETIADRICIGNYASMPEGDQLNEGRPAIDMSAAQIMDCCTWCGQGCQGGYPNDAMRYWNWNGVVTGGWYGSNCGCQPYQIPPCGPNGCSGPEANTPACSQSCRNGYANTFTQDKHYGADHYQLADANSIMQDIQTHGSVECGFTVYENFMSYTGGVYNQAQGNELGGHAVKIIGWGEENGTPYWLINNSWNTTWGLTGQFKFLRGQDLCGMEDGCVAGLAKSNDNGFQLTC